MQKLIKLRNQKGFTLIEIAIVLIIIGLLIGGILKGQAMIENARVKRLVKDMQGLQAAVFTYQDKYGMLPGDENDPNAPPGDTNNAGNPNDNDGIIQETQGWEIEDLRCAGLLPGTGITLPTHGFGGTLEVHAQDISGSGVVNQVIATNVPNDVCQEIDTKYDDGVYNTGDIRGSAIYTTAGNLTLGWQL